MSIVDALKKLVVAFGGASEPEEVPGANVADVIEELAKNPPSGGTTEPLIVNMIADGNGQSLDKTYREIADAFLSGRNVIVYAQEDGAYAYVFINQIYHSNGLYAVEGGSGFSLLTFTTEDPDGYPVKNTN